MASLLRPTDAGYGCLKSSYLTRSCSVGHVLSTMPLSHHHEQRFAVDAPEHASKTSAVKVDSLQHLTTFANTHTTLDGDVAVPDRAFGVQANAGGDAVGELRPQSLVRQAASNHEVVGCE